MPNQPADRLPAHATRRGWSARRSGAVLALLAVLAVVAALVTAGPGPSAPGSKVGGSPVALAGSPSPTVPSSAGRQPSATGDASNPPPSSAGSSGSTPSASDLPVGTPSTAPAAIPAARLQRKLDQLRTKASVPGVSVAILWDDGRSWVGASGQSDVAADRAVTPDSGFALASISKTFTAAVVLELVDEGHLSLDAPVAPLLPAYKLNRKITLRMLLDHTSGLPDFFLNHKIDAELQGAPDATWTPLRSWSLVTGKRPKPGKAWAYSNTNYLLLGEIVRKVTGHPLSTEVRTRLLDPLGLSNTWYQVAERPRATLTTGYRVVTGSGGKVRDVAVAPPSDVMPFRSVISAAGGAGSIASTALDTARWMQAFAGGRVLPPAMQQAMLADVANTRALDARVPYGLGIQQVTIAGHVALGHSGRYLGFRNVVRYLPVEGVTIAVLTNQGAYDPARIAAALLRIVLPPPPKTGPAPSASPATGAGPATQSTPAPAG
jgi:D-alanyl-D-alanine carboxypeptidase